MKYDISALGNALVDTQYKVSNDFVQSSHAGISLVAQMAQFTQRGSFVSPSSALNCFNALF